MRKKPKHISRDCQMYERSAFRNLEKNVYKFRKAHELDMETLSQIAKILYSHYSKIEKGETTFIMTSTLIRLGAYNKVAPPKVARTFRCDSEPYQNVETSWTT